jgi:hypothetical protein
MKFKFPSSMDRALDMEDPTALHRGKEVAPRIHAVCCYLWNTLENAKEIKATGSR